MQEMITTLGVALDGDMPVDPQAEALAAQSVPLADKVNSDGNPN